MYKIVTNEEFATYLQVIKLGFIILSPREDSNNNYWLPKDQDKTVITKMNIKKARKFVCHTFEL